MYCSIATSYYVATHFIKTPFKMYELFYRGNSFARVNFVAVAAVDVDADAVFSLINSKISFIYGDDL